MAKVRIIVVTLRIDIVAIDVKEDILGLDDLIAFIGSRRHVDHNHAASGARQLETGEVRWIFRLLPEKMKVPNAMVIALLMSLEHVLDLEGRLSDARASILRPKNAGDFRVIDDRLAPTDSLDFRTGFECN